MTRSAASSGLAALVVVLTSALLGALYSWYLNVEPFPADGVRLVPVAWLAVAVFGAVIAARALRSGRDRAAAASALLIDIPNVVVAGLFALAALMGD